jgi:polysaccharide export outer membrane protein
MRRALAGFVFLLLTLAAALPWPAAAQEETYRLDAGDLIKIQLYRDQDIDREFRIGANGRISYPLIGEVKAANLTPRELEEVIASRLKGQFFTNPKVTVMVVEYRPFYVNGEVEKPGGYSYQPGLTVRKAVSLAGGFKERASMSKIFLIKAGNTGADSVRVGLDTLIGPGDILTIEQSFF